MESEQPLTPEQRRVAAAASLRRFLEAEAELVRRVIPGDYEYPSFAELILREGKVYTPSLRPKGLRKQRDRMCYRNATLLALSNPFLHYVEGYALGIIPVRHAWLVTDDGTVVDPTWRLKRDEVDGLAYIGIPMSVELVSRAITLSGTYGVLDDPRHHYPLLRQPWDEAKNIALLRELLRKDSELERAA